MTWPDIDDLHRTAKQLVDSGRAPTQMEAEAVLERFVLQVDVGPGVHQNPAMQAALLTAVNAGHRAFLGGVVVRADENPTFSDGWASGMTLSDAVVAWGGRMTATHDREHPTLVVGQPRRPAVGDTVLKATFSGWAGGVVEMDSANLSDIGIALAGVLAGGLGVSESFQHCLGDIQAARRDVGLSLWQPESDWMESEAAGPLLTYLPAAMWLLGLGHLGQGYAWSLGFLPYAMPSAMTAYLVDTDHIVKGNLATGLLSRPHDVNQSKARTVAAKLEQLGIRTRIVERRFDELLMPSRDEPQLALAGFDDPAPRRLLGGNRFARVVDVGLGRGHVEYLDMFMHGFPSNVDPLRAFASPQHYSRALPMTYRDEIARLVASGEDEGQAACGMTEVAGITVGAAFVGAISGAIAMADVLRYLEGGPSFSVVALDLRSPAHVRAVPNPAPGPYRNIGFTSAR
jgi:hypothetical protein